MIYVRKANGQLQPFTRDKIVRTCLRLRAPLDVAEEIAGKLEKEVYNGMRTDEILRRIYNLLAEYNKVYLLHKDLRKAVSEMKSAPDFEVLVNELMRAEGYSTEMNRIVRGKCTSHEVDVFAYEDNERYMVEVKHHEDPHYYIGKSIPLQYWATMVDINEGTYKNYKLIIVSNSKYSDHAVQYAKCRGIKLIGWSYPPSNSLEKLIEKYRLHPITYLKSTNSFELDEFSKLRIVTLKDLANYSINELARRSLLKKDRLEELQIMAKKILEFIEKNEQGA